MSTTMTPALHPPIAVTPVTEHLTVVRAQRGDREAREELARTCQRQAYLLALQLTGRADEARDVAQEALLRFFAAFDRFDATRPVRPWLLRIVRNLVTDRARRARLRPTVTTASDEGAAVILEPVDPAPDPEARAVRRELEHALWRGLLELEPAHREIVALRDYLDLSYQEIAATLRLPVGTVMSRLHRARMALRRRLQERFGRGTEVRHA